MKLIRFIVGIPAVFVFGSVPAAPRPWIIAHRGASHEAPENTLAAFRLAWDQGADGIEADFFLTKDGRIACIHDETTKRTAGVDLRVADTTMADLRRLDVGSWKDSKWAGEKIPTIEEVLALVPKGKRIYVEVKCGPEIVPPLHRALAQSGISPSDIFIISFREPVIAEVKRTMPEIKAFWLVGYHKDEETGRWSPTIQEIVARLVACKADGLGTQATIEAVDTAFVQTLRLAGFEFHVWTVDSPQKARYFRLLGVDSITTNRPAFLRKQLSESP